MQKQIFHLLIIENIPIVDGLALVLCASKSLHLIEVSVLRGFGTSKNVRLRKVSVLWEVRLKEVLL